MNYKLVFSLEILAFITITFMAVAIEGPQGGLFGRKTFYGLSADAWLFVFTVPLFLLVIFLVHGFESKLFGTVAIGYFIGLITNDLLWFVVNPNFGISKFNSQFTTWLPWIKIGFLEIPSFYISHLFIAISIWFIFMKNAKRINKFLKRYGLM